MRRSKLLVMTGIDGSGKTTQAELLIDTLKRSGKNVTYTWTRWEQMLVKPLTKIWKRKVHKDTGHIDGRSIVNKPRKQKLLNNPVVRWLWLAAFFIDYGLQILIKVRFKMLSEGLIVSDRIYYDSVIDQVINLGDKNNWLIHNLDSPWMNVIFPKPDMVLYIDCPAEVAFSRKDDAPDIEYLRDRREVYLNLAERFNWIIIDGTLPVEAIADKVYTVVHERLNV